MVDYSDGALLMWHMAALEATRAEYPQIETVHLLLACCKLCDIPITEALQGASKSVQGRASLIESEIEEVQTVFRNVGLNPTSFRRRLRQTMGRLGMAPKDGIMHRSPEAKRVCLRAERYVEALGGAFVFPIHLLLHLMESQEEATWEPILKETGLSTSTLFAAVRSAAQQRDSLPGNLRILVEREPAPEAD